MSTTSTEVRAALRDWIARTAGVEPAAIADDTPIFGGGLLKSLHLMDLILLIEDLRGVPVDPDKLRPGGFRDLKTICAGFFGARSAA